MFAKRLLIILTAFAIIFCSGTIFYAENNFILFQVYAWEQNIDVFVAGDMNSDNLCCKVSNQAAEVIGSGLLADGDITIRTTILLDISTSIPTQTHGKVKSFIDLLIQNKSANEQYKFVIFGEQLTVLQDYTYDRYDLSNVADKIEFNGQQSKIYDAIYKTIPEVQPIDGTPCYYRTIVITDGIDDTESGVTREELYLKLQADTYPIDIVAVSVAEQAEPERQLSALTRMSNGRYVNLYPESDLITITSNLAVSGVFWIRAVIPGTLLDGSTRQFDITDGASSLQFDVKVPIYDVPVEEVSTATEEPLSGTLSSTTSAVPAVSTPAYSQQPSSYVASNSPGFSLDMFDGYTIVIFIGAGVGIIIAIPVIVAVIIVRKKQKRKNKNASYSNNASIISKETKILGTDSSRGSNGVLCIRLRNTSNPDQIWNLSLSHVIMIGRNSKCQVCIDEESMSRQQCKLYLINEVPSIENTSNSNVTQLNGEKILNPRPIKEGDKIKCGRVTVTVDSLYKSNSSNIGNLNKMTDFVNV